MPAKETNKPASTERRLSNLTLQTLRNYCDVKGIPGSSNLLKKDVISLIIDKSDPDILMDFLSMNEADYLMDSFRKAVKWGLSESLVQIGAKASEREMHAEFNGLKVGLRRVYYVDFFNISSAKNIHTACECDDSHEKGLFCPHQMAVLLRAVGKGKINLSRWKGPMTHELRKAIEALFPSL